jgi:hypothetical protein
MENDGGRRYDLKIHVHIYVNETMEYTCKLHTLHILPGLPAFHIDIHAPRRRDWGLGACQFSEATSTGTVKELSTAALRIGHGKRRALEMGVPHLIGKQALDIVSTLAPRLVLRSIHNLLAISAIMITGLREQTYRYGPICPFCSQILIT